ncbi:MAG: zinc-binding dehydrogenase [Actinomycetaceae bacterium]|nr:zinc-binding dehydrogenase [Actinomycetaceae bacterium]
MKIKAVRLHGVEDLRVDEFELPALGDDEILAEVVTDSICMSSHKLALQGEKHKRVRHKLAEEPIIVGHELCGTIKEVGSKWADKFKPGMRFTIQPALNYQGTQWAPGYSYRWVGGNATHVILPNEVMEMDCLLEAKADSFFVSSLAEPVSCVIGGFNAMYHTEQGSYEHKMGIVEGGSLALLASVGPMGLGAIDYAIHADRKPKRVVVTDIDQARLDRAASLLTVEDAAANGVELHYVNTGTVDDPVAHLIALNEGELYEDVIVFAPVRPVVEMGDALLAVDGCMNFFAGPTDTGFMATVNFYGVHYLNHHYVANSGGNNDDLVEALKLMGEGRLKPEVMVTHIGGLNAVPDTTVNLPKIPGGKKLIYTHKNLDLVGIDEFEARGATDPFYAELDRICKAHNGLWSKEAEDYLLENAPNI